MILNTKLDGRRIEKTIILSNKNDIYTRLEKLLGLKVSGQNNTLTEASNSIDGLYKRGEIQNEQQYRSALNKIHTQQMELPSKLLEQMSFSTRPKIEEHMLIVMGKNIHEEHPSQSLQTKNKEFESAVTLLTGYNGTFNVTKSNGNFYFAKSITDEVGFFQITRP